MSGFFAKVTTGFSSIPSTGSTSITTGYENQDSKTDSMLGLIIFSSIAGAILAVVVLIIACCVNPYYFKNSETKPSRNQAFNVSR